MSVRVNLAGAENIPLGPDERQRYARHLGLPGVGIEGQQRLKAASVLCIGAGGLGSPAALYLAAAGVGRIGIVDYDTVDITNLQRQILHGTSDVGKLKTVSANGTLAHLNSSIIVETFPIHLRSENATELFNRYDVVIDGSDNFPTRYLVNDACVLTGKPDVYGSILGFEGQVTIFWAAKGPCYRCLYPEPPPPGLVSSCAEGGVLGVLPGTIGCLQATEAIKLILGLGEPLIGRLLLFDALAMRFREMHLRKDPDCPVCGEHPTVTELADYEAFCSSRRGTATNEERTAFMQEISVRELKAKMDRGDGFTLLDVREPYEWEIAHIPGAKLMPLGEVAQRMGELDPAQGIVLQCHSGIRSAQALTLLQQAGFTVKRKLLHGLITIQIFQ